MRAQAVGRMGKFLSDTQYVFALEPYTDGTPVPTVVTKEVDMAVAAHFFFAKPDFSKTEVVKAYVYTTATVALAFDYWKEAMEGKEGAQLSRMKTVRHTGSVFNPKSKLFMISHVVCARCMSWTTRSRCLTSLG